MFGFEGKYNQLTEKFLGGGAEGESKQIYYFHYDLAQSTEMKVFHTVASLESTEPLCTI